MAKSGARGLILRKLSIILAFAWHMAKIAPISRVIGVMGKDSPYLELFKLVMYYQYIQQ